MVDQAPDRPAVEARHGRIFYFPQDDPIGKSLAMYGEWAEPEIEFLSTFIGLGSAIIDVGAYLGTHTLAFSRRVGPGGSIRAFEPQRAVFELLERTLADNRCTNVTAFRAGVGRVAGEMLVPTVDYTAHANVGGVALTQPEPSNADLDSWERTPIVALDDLALDACNLVKVDAVRMEGDVLAGMADTIRRLRPVVCAECNDVDAGAAILRAFEAPGYCFFLVRTAAFNPANHRGNPNNFFGFARECNLLGLPEEVCHLLPASGTEVETVPIAGLQELAEALLKTPRYGDNTSYDRDPARLREELRAAEGRVREADERVGVLQAEVARLEFRAASLAQQLRHVETDGEPKIGAPRSSLAAPRRLKLSGGATRRCRKAAKKWFRSLFRRVSPGVAQAEPPDRAADLPGQRALVAASGLFDPDFYLQHCPDAAASRLDPIEHYLLNGWRQGLDPGPRFSTKHYLAFNGDVRDAGLNPLLHYLTDGKDAGRLPVPKSVSGAKPVAPTPEEWEAVTAAWQGPPAAPAVDVLVPVYLGRDETMRCLLSVLSAPQRTPYRLVAIDDCSPDQSIRERLDAIAARGLVELHRTEHNLGFVGACNLGMSLHQERDIVLLNSDTEVFGDWLDRLREAAYRRPRTASVTPLSNNAEICSYPCIAQDNWCALEVHDAELDRLAARVNAGAEVEIPTGIGFCMFVRRACLDEIGLFDTEHFGKGYGEENDLCRRAAAHGWRHILAPNVFVRHYGATSFGASKTARVKSALRTIKRLHPDYPRLVSDFIRKDTARPCREALDAARLSHRARHAAMLFVTHNWGGGTERHVQDLSRLLETNDIPVFFCRADPKDPRRIRIDDPATPNTPNLPSFDVGRDLDRFARFLLEIGVAHVHVHHLAGFPESAPDFIRAACIAADLAYDVTVHDYLAVCPRINLIDGTGFYCGEPDLATCEACIGRNGSPFGHPSVWAWRERHARLLTGARRVFVPDADVSRRLRRRLSDVAYSVRPHPEAIRADPPAIPSVCDAAAQGHTRLRKVALLGAVGLQKGSALLADTARAALRRDLPLQFVVVGYTNRDKELRALPNVAITGPYEEDKALERLAAVGADLAWFPAVWPETYSYTLSIALTARTYPVAFDLGAIASRIREAGWGELMPLERMLDPEWIVERLTRLTIPDPPAQLLSFCIYPEPLVSYYELPEGFRSGPVQCHDTCAG